MHTLEYINKDIKPLYISDKIKKAQKLFEQNKFSHLPVVDNNSYCGLIERQTIKFTDFKDKKLVSLKNQFQIFYAADTVNNWFEILQSFASYNSNFIPVLNKNKEYIGYYELDDFLEIFKRTPFLHEEGVILVISKNINEYSFSEITQIVESNNATLFGAFISKIENDEAQIVLKLSIHDINNTLLSFRRYNYRILNEFKKDKYIDELNERSEYLQKYLNI